MTMPISTHVERHNTQTTYAADVDSIHTVASGSVVTISTHDTRSGALLDREPAVAYELPKPDRSKGNPVTGPIRVEGAKPGDGLLVEILSIECDPIGWCGAHAHVGPVPTGRVPRALGRTCRVHDGVIEFSSGISVPMRPMIGCIGTAPLVPASTQIAGAHGGNMDQSVVRAGTTVLLPVAVEGALLSIGDVHAAQGDGELSGIALEIPATVTVRVSVLPAASPAWPWIRTDDSVAVMTVAETFESASALAVDEGMKLLEQALSLEAAEALSLLSITSSIRIGAAWGGPQVSVRLEIPHHLGVAPEGLRGK